MNKWWAKAKAFLADTDGNVAIIFGIAMIPLIGFVGASIDYSRAASLRTALQAALDATALMSSKTAATQSAAELQASAQAYFDAVFVQPEAQGTQLKAVYAYNNGAPTVTVTGTTAVKTDFMGVLGVRTIPVGSSSTVTWGNTKLRVALVLDNSGSMASAGKMTALKSATHQLLATLKAAATNPGDVQVSIVPFSKDVNIGKGNYQATWLKWSGQSDTWDENNGSCSIFGYSTKASCTSRGWCSNSFAWTQQQCTLQGGTWSSAVWTPKSHSAWNGCITDRDKDPDVNYDVSNRTPHPDKQASLFVPQQYSFCPPGIVLPLGYDWNALSNAVDAMQPNGSTNQTIGLALGWQTLTPDAPFSASPPKSDTVQVIILLSDGLNTQNRWDGNGSDTSAQVDARMALACANAKADKIEIYTIQVNTGGDKQSKVLPNCASGSDHFSMVTTSNQIITTFSDIATRLAQLRISK